MKGSYNLSHSVANFKVWFFAISLILITGSSFAQNTKDSLDPKVEALKNLDTQLESIANEIELIHESMRLDSIIPEDTVYLTLIGQKLWPIHLSFGPLSPQERVDLIHENLDEISFFNMDEVFDSLKIEKTNQGFKVENGKKILFYVTNEDAILLHKTPEELANEYVSILQKNMKANVLYENNQDLLWRIAKVIGIVIILYILIRFLNVGYRKLNKYLTSLRGGKIHNISVKDFEIINDRQVVRIVLLITRVIRLILVLFLIYLSLPIIFGLFPWTEAIAETMLSYVLDPLHDYFWAFIGYIPNLISIAIISYIGYFIIKFIGYLSSEVEKENLQLNGFYPEWAKPTANLLRFIIYIVLLIFIFPFLPGSDSPIFKGVSVFVGILITMGSSSSVNNIIAGFILTYMRPFKIGDRIKIDDIYGFVTEKSLLVTRLRTSKQEIITVPNSKILATNIINYSTSIQENDGVIIHTIVTIGYDVPWRKVHKALLKAADSIETISKKPKPFVLQTSLDDYYVSYEINAYVTDVKTIIGTHSKLNEQIQDEFRDAGIEILSPHYKSMRDGSESTIPKKVKEDYTFKAEQVEDNTPELDQQEEDEKKAAQEKAKVKKTEVPTNFVDLIEKVQESSSKDEDEKEDHNPEKKKTSSTKKKTDKGDSTKKEDKK